MPIQVRLFASLRERAGWSERLVTPEQHPATPWTLWQQLQLPAGAVGSTAPAAQRDDTATTTRDSPAGGNDLPPGIRVAINQSFAAPDTPLADGDELAFLPPISGG